MFRLLLIWFFGKREFDPSFRQECRNTTRLGVKITIGITLMFVVISTLLKWGVLK